MCTKFFPYACAELTISDGVVHFDIEVMINYHNLTKVKSTFTLSPTTASYLWVKRYCFFYRLNK